jgi:hypothetical protein
LARVAAEVSRDVQLGLIPIERGLVGVGAAVDLHTVVLLNAPHARADSRNAEMFRAVHDAHNLVRAVGLTILQKFIEALGLGR